MLDRARKYLSIILQIFVRDLKRLVVNPVACIILAGVCILPALYAWYTIETMWDPYANTGSIKVAVVNEDKGADSNYTGKINIGQEVVDELHSDHELDWQFVSKDEAMDGVYSSEYYAALIFPENFSEDFISVFSGNFTQPKIEYYVNEKLSGSGTKVTDSAASKIETTIDESFVSQVSNKVVEIAQRTGGAVHDKSEQSTSLLSHSVEEARNAISQNRTMVNDLTPTIDSSIHSVDSSNDLLKKLVASLPALDARLDSASTSLENIRKTLNDYSATLSAKVTESAFALTQAAVDINLASAQIAGDIQTAKANVDTALAEARELVSYNNQLLESLRNSPVASTDQVQKAISDIEAQNASLSSTITSLEQLANQLDNNAQAVKNATDTVANVAKTSADNLQKSAKDFQITILPEIDTSLDSLASAIGTLRGATESLRTLFDQESTLLTQLASMLEQSKSICAEVGLSLEALENNLESTYTDLRSLQNSASFKELTTLLGMNPDDVSSFMSSPVKLDTVALYPVNPYGSGIAPFFSNLALWVCGFILMAIVRLRVDPVGLPRFSATQAYFGRWLFYVSIGIIQSLIICIGDLVLGIQCENPAAFIGAGVLAGFVYVNLLYALAYSIRHIGKALAVVLLVLQIPGSSGMFPVEMMPEFYQVLNPLLPFTYSIDAMREAIGGMYGAHYLIDMLILGGCFIPVGLFIGLMGVHFGYNVNTLFDAKLSQTELFASESVPKGAQWFRLRPVLLALMQTKQYREKIIARAMRFDTKYPLLMKIGWIALFAMPILMLVTLILFEGSPNEKLILLSWFILGTLIVAGYQIIILFLHADIQYQFKLAQSEPASDAGKIAQLETHEMPEPLLRSGGGARDA
ncbi:MAG: YhgE/Pip domain-containing protein [Eggerthellaceae bacterium]